VVGSTVYVASVEGNVYALNTDTSSENDSDDTQREENNSSIEVEFDNVNEENKVQVANTEEAQVSGTITNINTFNLYMYSRSGNYPDRAFRVDVSTDDSFSTEYDFSDVEVGSEFQAVVRTEDNAELDTTDVVVVEPPVMPESESETAEVNLRIYNFDVPDSVAPNSTFVVSGSVENTGEADASGRATLSVEGETLDSADSIEANSLTTLSGSVNAGEAGSSKTVTIEIPNGGSESQTITVETRTDADTDRAETNTDADTDDDNTQSNSDEEDASSNEDFDLEEEILELISRLFG
jgi:hypothetical protein